MPSLSPGHRARRSATAAIALGALAVAVPALPAAASSAGSSWSSAWATHDHEELRDWFAANTGPTEPVEGTAAGGKITDQDDADRLAGKEVTGSLSVSCDCTLRDFVLEDASLTITGGSVTVEDALIDGAGDTGRVGVVTVKGSARATLERVEITGHHDGIRAYGRSVTGEHVYIHDVADDNPEGHHQDGVQVMSGTAGLRRSFIDMTGAHTSAILVKPDAGPITKVVVDQSVVMGGKYTFHVHDGPEGTPKGVDLSGNLVAKGYGSGLVSTWKLTDPGAITTTARVSPSGKTVTLEDGAKL